MTYSSLHSLLSRSFSWKKKNTACICQVSNISVLQSDKLIETSSGLHILRGMLSFVGPRMLFLIENLHLPQCYHTSSTSHAAFDDCSPYSWLLIFPSQFHIPVLCVCPSSNSVQWSYFLLYFLTAVSHSSNTYMYYSWMPPFASSCIKKGYYTVLCYYSHCHSF